MSECVTSFISAEERKQNWISGLCFSHGSSMKVQLFLFLSFPFLHSFLSTIYYITTAATLTILHSDCTVPNFGKAGANSDVFHRAVSSELFLSDLTKHAC